ncbi:MAG: hypothetical protein JSR28_11900 [Proteobacteria bacterium]|nr:hypothetical protein [Pseudomonadota bacterium]
MTPRTLLALALIPFLAACGGGSGGGTVKTAATRPAPVKTAVRAPVRHAPGPAQIQTIPGLEGVIGATSAELSRQFGPPRLDVIEGDARKLQFSGTACVLDIYLYPSAPGREPTATYVDARRASDGQDVDRAACAGALLHRPAAARQG